jgi:hypothetical protein
LFLRNRNGIQGERAEVNVKAGKGMTRGKGKEGGGKRKIGKEERGEQEGKTKGAERWENLCPFNISSKFSPMNVSTLSDNVCITLY